MRRNRNKDVKKERIVMITCSAFVLTALTLTGVYLRNQNMESKDDGYTIDFAALESKSKDKINDITENMENADRQSPMEESPAITGEHDVELDFSPESMEGASLAGSDTVKNPGVKKKENKESLLDEASRGSSSAQEETDVEDEVVKPSEAATGGSVILPATAHMEEGEKLLMPVKGEIKMPFCMDKSIYFETLDQYKYNPAMIISADEGTPVIACTDGIVSEIFENEEIGHAIILDLGDGYQAVYGQLSAIEVQRGSYVCSQTILGKINSPTKYYSLEGANLYFQVLKDGVPINPQNLF